MAPAAYLLFQRIMEHNPRDPQWPDRDRFVLSAGHGSMLLYAVLHLSGYDLPLDDLKRFRQWGSLTPGHPERDRVHVTPGVEVTTGPLGQGFANGVGMAMAERFLRERYGREVQDHHIFAIVSDGDLMEGVASEAASLAGHLGLGRLVYLYDDNHISLDGPTVAELRRRGRHEALRGLRLARPAGRRRQRPRRARGRDRRRRCARRSARRSSACARSSAGPRRNKQGTSKAHGAPLGEDEVRATKEVARLGPGRALPRARRRLRALQRRRARRGRCRREWERALRRVARRRTPTAPPSGTPRGPGGRCRASPTRCATIDWGKDKLATRVAGQKAMAAFAPFVPTMVGGAADLSESTKTEFPGGDDERYTRDARGPQRLLRRARARHGRGRQRHGRPRRHRAPVRLDVPAVRRLHARLDPPVGADGARRSRGSTRTTRSASARTARRTSRSSTSRRCARSRA